MEAQFRAKPLDAVALADLIGQLLTGIERGSKQWTLGRRKESLRRMLEDVRGDGADMRTRLLRLVATWNTSDADTGIEPATTTAANDALGSPGAAAASGTPDAAEPAAAAAAAEAAAVAMDLQPWNAVIGGLASTVIDALPGGSARANAIAQDLRSLREQIVATGATAGHAEQVDTISHRARRLLQHRAHLSEQTGRLCGELAQSLAELAEDDSWARGQCETICQRLEEGLNARSVRAVTNLLHETRERQKQVRSERGQARDALKTMIQRMLSEVGELGQQTGRFSEDVTRYAGVIERADSLESLTDTVREMLEASHDVSQLINQTQGRLKDEHARATELSDRVRTLEDELRRLSDEVSTDALTGVANRRGLQAAFDIERARCERSGKPLAIGLLDIDNFKRLNDTLGHTAGDQALVALAKRVEGSLRPTDKVARYGGEEFVVLLPETNMEEAQVTLSRLQRALTQSLFMHENKQVFVTFSAGVSLFRTGERLDETLERADEGLYEAKRSGKNRTCAA